MKKQEIQKNRVKNNYIIIILQYLLQKGANYKDMYFISKNCDLNRLLIILTFIIHILYHKRKISYTTEKRFDKFI